MAGIDSVSSVSTGIETPDAMQLRKKAGDGTGTETPDTVKGQPFLVVVKLFRLCMLCRSCL